jgi:hypothetical protein
LSEQAFRIARAQSNTVSGKVLMQNPASRKVMKGGEMPIHSETHTTTHYGTLHANNGFVCLPMNGAYARSALLLCTKIFMTGMMISENSRN